MPIRVLSPEMVGQIAAGEVVERPASIVKELVENAMDARASQITVELVGGGLRLVRVSDDGIGIPSDEVELAFQRHATSKLSQPEDLFRIATLGFRGEALPSIAAVSHMTMLTRPADQPAGTFLSLKNGEVEERGVRAGPAGTTVTVRQLFANVPARLKFLRSSTTEVGHVSQLICQLALAYPEVRFTLLVEGRSTFQSAGRGDRREVLARVYGVEVARAMLEVGESRPQWDAPDSTLRVWGYACPPALARVGRQYLSFFVNRRLVQSRTLARAAEDAYGSLLQVGRRPIVVLDLALPPEGVDVNVHPAKREVKFQREQAVYAAVHRAVRTAVASSSPVTTFGSPLESPLPGATTSPALTPSTPSFAFNWPEPSSPHSRANTAAANTSMPLAQPESRTEEGRLPILRVVGQVGSTYIIAEGPEGMYLIDQHTAHERVLFERLLAQSRERTVEVQGLLEPLAVEVSPVQAGTLASQAGGLSDLGFVFEPFGERTFLLRAVPAVLRGTNLREAFIRVVDALENQDASDQWRERACLSLACHSAVRSGQNLSMEEMRELVRLLERTELPHTCPHGRPILILLSAAQLEREFGRR